MKIISLRSVQELRYAMDLENTDISFYVMLAAVEALRLGSDKVNCTEKIHNG